MHDPRGLAPSVSQNCAITYERAHRARINDRSWRRNLATCPTQTHRGVDVLGGGCYDWAVLVGIEEEGVPNGWDCIRIPIQLEGVTSISGCLPATTRDILLRASLAWGVVVVLTVLPYSSLCVRFHSE